ncbi:lycopene cyclase family protein [Gordonia sp. LSe1-13]|uniref:Lycopene cyclase family protein n=1 Tax=Gordonia sesuvii TaxID=3116777 RepID=A0ABU7MCK5_9ACTN|nr:lycopene cyclase family protein [Gordonia sp. LSe1-13]
MTRRVTVLGAGPAGRGVAHRMMVAGLDVTVVEAHPDREWRATYACWSDELPAWLDPTAIAAQVDSVRVIGTTDVEVDRGYTVCDTAALQRGLTLDDARVLQGRVAAVDGDRVRLADGTSIAGDVVIDCRGTAIKDAPRQTAFGIVVDAATAERYLDGAAAVIMDWRAGQVANRDELPSFLYAVPLGQGEFLLEETCLAGHPALPLDELERRLYGRLGSLADGARRTERVTFPLIAADRRPWRGRPFPFGAAGGFVHPTTGYSVAAALRTADDLVGAVLDGADPARRLWSPPARAVYDLRLRGLGVLLRLDPIQTTRFFEAFFAMPVARQRSYLSERDDLAGTLGAMSRVFGRLDNSLRATVARASAASPSASIPGWDAS